MKIDNFEYIARKHKRKYANIFIIKPIESNNKTIGTITINRIYFDEKDIGKKVRFKIEYIENKEEM